MRAHVIFCDDIRQELTGKLILVGVYTGDMAIGIFKDATRPPAPVIATYIELRDLSKGTHDLTAEVRFRSGDETRVISNIEWETEIEYPDSPSIISPTGLRFSTDKSGVIEMWIKKVGDEDAILAGTLAISVHPAEEFPD